VEFFEIFLSVLTTLVSVVALQGRNMIFILVFQLLSNLLVVLQFIISNNISAAGVCMLAVLQIVVIFLFQRKSRAFPVWLIIIFIVGYGVVSAFCYVSPYDLISLAAAVMFAISVVQTKPAMCRFFVFLNASLWIVFDILSSSYTAIPVHSAILLFNIISIIRLDLDFWREAFLRAKEKKK